MGNKKEERILKSDETKVLTLTIKEEISGSTEDLIKHFHDMIWFTYRKHHFNISNQYKYYTKLQDNITPTECLIQIDFAINYVGKMANVI